MKGLLQYKRSFLVKNLQTRLQNNEALKSHDSRLAKKTQKMTACAVFFAVFDSSFIQTILSVLEFHQILPIARLADFTADREFHPALKIKICRGFCSHYDLMSSGKLS